MFFLPVQLTTSKIVNLNRLIITPAMCDDHTYILGHTFILSCKIIHSEVERDF